MKLFIGSFSKEENSTPSTWTLVCVGQPSDLWNIAKNFLLQIKEGLDLYFVPDEGQPVIGYYRDRLNEKDVKK